MKHRYVRQMVGSMAFFFFQLCSAQGFWNDHYAGNNGLISSMLFPVEIARKPFVGFSIQTQPYFSMASQWNLIYCRPIKSLKTHFQGSVSAFTFGPYQERSFRGMVAREFGNRIFVAFQPEYRQVAVQAYGAQGSFAYSASAAYHQGSWKFSLFWRQDIQQTQAVQLVQMAWTYAINERIQAGLSLRKQQGLFWQSLVDVQLLMKKEQSIHVGFSGKQSFFLGYEMERNRWRLRFSLFYSSPLGMYPENAFRYAW